MLKARRSPLFAPAATALALLLTWSLVNLAAAPADGETAAANAAQKLPRPVLDMHHLMELFNEPYYERLKEEMQTQPADDRGWKHLVERGQEGAEIINLVAIREMGDEHKQVWPELTRTAHEAALGLADAAKTKNWERTREAYVALVQNCNDCHQKLAPEEAPMLEP